MAVLLVESGLHRDESYILDDDLVTIGREESNIVCLHQDHKISRKHAVIEKQDDGSFIIRDLNSSNGTRVNGVEITEQRLVSGDQITVGNSILLFGENGLEELAAVQKKKEEERRRLIRGGEAETQLSTEEWDEGSIQAVSSQKADVDELINTFAGQPAALGAEELKRLQNYLLATHKVSQMISTAMEIEELLDRILQAIFEVVKADRGFIAMLDEKTGELDEESIHRYGIDSDKLTISRTIVNRVINNDEVVLASDAMTDERFGKVQSIVDYSIRSAICVPLKGTEKILGVIHVDTVRSSGSFTENDLHLLEIIGGQAGIAVERARLYEENLRAARLAAIGQFVAGLAHDIKNIVQGMQGGNALLDFGLKDKKMSAVKEGADIIGRFTKRISDLVMDMLSFSKDREPEYKACNVNELLKDVALTMRPKAEQNSAKIELNLDENVKLIEIDPTGIHRCVMNIVSNGIDALNGNEGEIILKSNWSQNDEYLEISISDNGVGIPKENLDKIFELFSSTKGSKGTGLGLAVTKKIIDEHNGRIAVESEIGKGTTFHIWLPKREPPEGTVEEATFASKKVEEGEDWDLDEVVLEDADDDLEEVVLEDDDLDEVVSIEGDDDQDEIITNGSG